MIFSVALLEKTFLGGFAAETPQVFPNKTVNLQKPPVGKESYGGNIAFQAELSLSYDGNMEKPLLFSSSYDGNLARQLLFFASYGGNTAKPAELFPSYARNLSPRLLFS